MLHITVLYVELPGDTLLPVKEDYFDQLFSRSIAPGENLAHGEYTLMLVRGHPGYSF